jgi:hypothetical protein
MSQPMFLLQIVSTSDGHIATFPGGGELEADFVLSATEAIVKRGVGVLKTQKQVEQAIRDGLTEAIMALKRQSRYAR